MAAVPKEAQVAGGDPDKKHLYINPAALQPDDYNEYIEEQHEELEAAIDGRPDNVVKESDRVLEVVEKRIAAGKPADPNDLERGEIGDHKAETVWPNGANAAGVPDYLPLYEGETGTLVRTHGDTTFWNTSMNRKFSVKNQVAVLLPQAASDPDFPDPDDLPDSMRPRGMKRADEKKEAAESRKSTSKADDKADTKSTAADKSTPAKAAKAEPVAETKIEQEDRKVGDTRRELQSDSKP